MTWSARAHPTGVNRDKRKRKFNPFEKKRGSDGIVPVLHTYYDDAAGYKVTVYEPRAAKGVDGYTEILE